VAKNLVEVIISFVKKGTGDTEAKTGLSKLSAGFKELTGFSLGAATALGVVGIGLQKGVKFLKDSVTETVNYNRTVREMTQVLGLSADETSRVIQVADDWGISIEQVRTSLGMMNKNGVQPSIENLAQLADEYVNTSDKTAFAEKAAKLFGRSYQDMIPLLAKGGKALRDQAAAVDDSLIATQEAIDKSREYEVVVDNLNDTWTGFKRTLGNAVLPTLTIVLKTIDEETDKIGDINKAQAEWERLTKLGIVTGKENLQLQKDLASKGWASSEERLILYNNAIEEHTADLKKAGEEYRTNFVPGMQAYWKAITNNTEATEEQTAALIEVKTAQELYNDAMQDLSFLMGGSLTDAEKEFTEQQVELGNQMQEIKGKIDLLNSLSYVTPEQFTELQNLQTEYGDLSKQYTTNADEHEKATKRILLDLFMQEAAQQGLANSDVWMQMALDWGLISQAEYDAMQNADLAVNWLRDHPEDVAGMEAILLGADAYWVRIAGNIGLSASNLDLVRQKWDAIHSEHKELQIDVIYNEQSAPSYGPGQNQPIIRQHGGVDYVTRPTMFMAGESGPEAVITVPQTSNYFNINMSGYGNPAQDMTSAVRLLELLYG
jgi:hypothetical protein